MASLIELLTGKKTSGQRARDPILQDAIRAYRAVSDWFRPSNPLDLLPERESGGVYEALRRIENLEPYGAREQMENPNEWKYAAAPDVGGGGMRFHRYTAGDDPLEFGYGMFARNQDSVRHYGSKHWEADLSQLGPGEIADASDPALRADMVKALRKQRDRLSHEGPVAPLVRESNPERIVNSAGMWDDLDATAIIWEEVLEPRGIRAVVTEDGALIFDPQLISSAK